MDIGIHSWRLTGIYLALAVLFLFIPLFAFADGTLDQEYTVSTLGEAHISQNNDEFIQTFPVTLEGDLTSVDIKVRKTPCVTTAGLWVEIVATNDDIRHTPTDTVLASRLFAPGEVSDTIGGDWLSFDFDPIEAATGTVFGIRASSTADVDTGCVFTYNWAIGRAQPNDPDSYSYVDGILFHNAHILGYDADFRSYVEDNPNATNPGTDVEVTPEAVDVNGDPTGEDVVSFTFDEVTEGGDTTVTVRDWGDRRGPAGFRIGFPPTFFDLDTTAEFVGDVEICIDYSNVSYFNENRLALFHDNNGTWEDITTSLNTDNNLICGSTDSFSDFAVLEEKTPPELLADLESEVEALDISNVSMILLGGRLKIAQHLLEDDNDHNDRAVVPILNSFLRGVARHEKFGIITSEEATSLTDHAQEIIDLLN